MTKNDLVTEIEAYAMAKSTGNPSLIQRQGAVLKALLDKLPETLLAEGEQSQESPSP